MTIRRICSYAITPWIFGGIIITGLISGYVAVYRISDRNNWFLESPGATRAVNINMTILMFGCAFIACTALLGLICAWVYQCTCATIDEHQANIPWRDTTAGRVTIDTAIFATAITVICSMLTCLALLMPEHIYPDLQVERGLPRAWFWIPFLKTLLLGTYIGAALVIAAFGYMLMVTFLRDLHATQEQCQKAKAD